MSVVTQPEKCDCGADIIYVNGHRLCTVTLARYRALHGGDPKPCSPNTSTPVISTNGD